MGKSLLSRRSAGARMGLVLALLLAVSVNGMAAASYFVATDGDDTAAGTNWSTALLTISNGVSKATAAGAGSSVTISNGVYVLSTQVVVSAGITVQGVTTNPADVVVNGNHPVVTNRCFYLSNAGAVLANLTITNGFAVPDGLVPTYSYGGGVYLNGGTVRNCLIAGNTATNHGGGVYAPNVGGCVLMSCTVAGNVSSNGSGGGVYCANIAYLYDCVISNNLAPASAWPGGYGGGVYLGGAGWIRGGAIVGNEARSIGGGVYLGTGATLTNCLIQNNRLAGSGGYGAGVHNSASKVLQCRIIGNNAGLAVGGGVSMYQLNGQTVFNCQIISNVAAGGGGIYFVNCNSTVRNCLIAGNTATDAGGGVYHNQGSASWVANLVNCTVAGNMASNKTGGVLCAIAGNNINCVIYSNGLVNGTTTNWATNWFGAGAAITYTNCCTLPTNSLNGSGNIEADPLLAGPASGNYHLRGASSCVNAGLYASWMTNSVDLDGQPRIRYDRVDIGCYECLYQGMIFSSQ